MERLKSWLYLCAGLGLVAALLAPAQACVGARPYGMGFAFVPVADDVNATYWNPAGLVQLEDREVSVARNMNKRDEINYQDYLAYAQTLDDNSAIGVSYINRGKPRQEHDVIKWVTPDLVGIGDLWEQDSYWISYAYKVGEDTSLGVNLRHIADSTPFSRMSFDTDLGLDVGVLHKLTDELTFGLLIQNANEPDTQVTVMGVPVTPIENFGNWRPGIAYRPEPTLTFALSVYDAFDVADGMARHLQLGIEKVVDDSPSRYLAWRLGYTGLLADDDATILEGATLGLGIGTGAFRVDAAYLLGDFDDAWFLSGTAAF